MHFHFGYTPCTLPGGNRLKPFGESIPKMISLSVVVVIALHCVALSKVEMKGAKPKWKCAKPDAAEYSNLFKDTDVP
jgi:hypothetical protein